MFRKMPFILIGLIACVGVFCRWLPDSVQAILYGVSLSLKSLIVFVLPLVIFCLLFRTAASLAKQASKWLVLVLATACISSFVATLFSYGIGSLAYQLDLSFALPDPGKSLAPLGNFSLPQLVSNTFALGAGLLSGIACGWAFPSLAQRVSSIFDQIVSYLMKGIICIIPLFMIGFIVKMVHDGMLSLIFEKYIWILALVGGSVFFYIGLLYLALHQFQVKPWAKSLKNMLPAALAGFGSMSSVAAMPLTLLGVEKNAKNPESARAVVPLTVNIHLIGDCFAIPIFAFALLKSFSMEAPELTTYLPFAIYFVLAKFSVAAVPGGGILVMLPVLESHLGLKGDMLSLITALYILFDPITTPANILGNGALAVLLGKGAKKQEEATVSGS